MEKQYSKGNWSANGLHIRIEGKTGSQGQAFRQDVMVYEKKDHKDVEALANAKLMASAPELLEKLENLLKWAESFADLQEIREARLVIEKALTL